MMAVSIGMFVGGKGNPVLNINLQRRRNFKVMASFGLRQFREEYKLLGLSAGASETQVKKAYRRLALQYHPDVCKGHNCCVQFEKISEAYKTVLGSLVLTGEKKENKYYCSEDDNAYVEVMMGDEWEEWMGWEGGSVTRDYSNHINTFA